MVAIGNSCFWMAIIYKIFSSETRRDNEFLLCRNFQILLRTKCVPSLVKIHWRMLILECSQGCYAVKNYPVTLIFDLENQ
jgi:hypothetical protein